MRVAGGTRDLTISQWSNDWITADPVTPRPDDKPLVLSPLKVHLTPDEVVVFRLDEQEAAETVAAGKTHRTGTFWQEWILADTGYFKRRMQYGRRPPVRASGSS